MDAEARNAKRKSIDIDRQLLIDKRNMSTESKILLLGKCFLF